MGSTAARGTSGPRGTVTAAGAAKLAAELAAGAVSCVALVIECCSASSLNSAASKIGYSVTTDLLERLAAN